MDRIILKIESNEKEERDKFTSAWFDTELGIEVDKKEARVLDRKVGDRVVARFRYEVDKK